MSKTSHFKLEDFLPYRLSILSNRISQGIAGIYQKKHTLSIIEWRIMAILGSYPNSSASEIVEHTVMDKVAISRGVKKLLKSELILRKPDRYDGRRMNLRLSKQGKEVYQDIIPKAMDFEHQFIDRLSSKDLNDLDRIINKLFKVLKN